eukprot:scaffold285_cov330-Pavlova_lutheri.AAC.13
MAPSRRRGWDLLWRATQRLRSAGGPVPKWWDAVQAVPPPPPLPRRSHPALRLRFREDPLEQGFRARHASAKLEPVPKGEVPPARAFAIRQLQLMEQGVSKDEARQTVEEEWRKRGVEGEHAPEKRIKARTKNVLEQIQEEEERELRNALVRLRAAQNMPE